MSKNSIGQEAILNWVSDKNKKKRTVVEFMVWEDIVSEASRLASQVPIDEVLVAYLKAAVLSHKNFQSALVTIISTPFMSLLPMDTLRGLLLSVYEIDNGIYEVSMPSLIQIASLDIQAVLDRDPAAENPLDVILNFKGFKALQAHRIAHALWRQNRKELALLLQSLASQAYGVDIHPAANLGHGLMLDHGSGIVIGETTVVGINCSFLHGVTLGASGKEMGDRHPKLGNNVLIGCNATILGNISIGDSCKIGSGSIVTKSIPAGATAVGNPARVIGRSTEQNSAANVDWALKNVETHQGTLYYKTWSINSDGSGVFEEVDTDHTGKLNLIRVVAALTLRFNIKPPSEIVSSLFQTHDVDHDGYLTKAEFENLSDSLLRYQNPSPKPLSSASSDHNLFLQGASLAASSL